MIVRSLLSPLFAGLLYFAGARLGVAASGMSEGIAIFWLPNGVLLAALLLAPVRAWPAYLLAAVLAEVAADLPVFSLAQALGFAAINLFECLLAATLLRRVARPYSFDRLRNVVWFGAIALLLAPALAALLGAGIYARDAAPGASFWLYWRIWWFGDSLGLLLAVPLLLCWLSSKREIRWWRALEATGVVASAAALAWWVFMADGGRPAPLIGSPFLLLPVLLWPAVRFGVRETAAVGLLVAIIVILANLSGLGPFVSASPVATVLKLQEYLATLLFSALALAALLQELRDRNASLLARERELSASQEAVRQLNQELESRVRARTEELQRANQLLEQLASVDALTGASNRRHFLEIARIEVDRAQRLGRPLAAIMLDLDHFKEVNDRHGHEAGDRVLQTFANAVHATLRSSDIFARLGGEEFMLLLPGQTQEEACALAERLRSLTASLDCVECPEGITVSIGVATLGPEGAHDLHELMRQADGALYLSKHAGRNRVSVAAGAPATGQQT
jgi:diguanylate cyclase (GGDEF)-like protein